MSIRSKLITIPASHYCEKARWALDLAHVQYLEEGHVPLFHYFSTLWRGGRSVPLLSISGQDALTDSTDILQYVSNEAPHLNLYPDEESRELEGYFDTKLGPHARRYAYHQLFKRHDVASSLLQIGVSPIEAAVSSVAFPVVKTGLLRSLNITPETAQRSLTRCRTIFDEMSERLEKRGPDTHYLSGDGRGPTAADITFASLASLLLFPPQCRSLQPDMAMGALDGDATAVVEELRATRAGQAAMEVYARHRLINLADEQS